MDEKFTIGMIVNNQAGVLNRVAGLFGKRCYNIDSITVGETENQQYSRMTIVSRGDEYTREQVIKQLSKLYDVKKVCLLPEENAISREHLLIKMHIPAEMKAKATEMINSFGGKILDFWDDCVTVEITDSSQMIDEFIHLSARIGILEICRSGCIAMVQGKDSPLTVEDL